MKHSAKASFILKTVPQSVIFILRLLIALIVLKSPVDVFYFEGKKNSQGPINLLDFTAITSDESPLPLEKLTQIPEKRY